MGRDVNDVDDGVVLAGSHHLLAVRREPGDFGGLEYLPSSEISGAGELPHAVAKGVDDHHPVATPVRDQDGPGQRIRV